jgi:hypothetical protein
MRSIIVMMLLGWASAAHATDDFGDRFGNQSPAALESLEITADQLGAMEPAAGDEEEQEGATADAVPAATGNEASSTEAISIPGKEIVYE